MRAPRVRMTVFRLLLLIVIAAMASHSATDPNRARAAGRRERCLELAARHASLGSEYRRNAGGDAIMLEGAAWHEHMRREFERAAGDRTIPQPRSRTAPGVDRAAGGRGPAMKGGAGPPRETVAGTEDGQPARSGRSPQVGQHQVAGEPGTRGPAGHRAADQPPHAAGGLRRQVGRAGQGHRGGRRHPTVDLGRGGADHGASSVRARWHVGGQILFKGDAWIRPRSAAGSGSPGTGIRDVGSIADLDPKAGPG